MLVCVPGPYTEPESRVERNGQVPHVWRYEYFLFVEFVGGCCCKTLYFERLPHASFELWKILRFKFLHIRSWLFMVSKMLWAWIDLETDDLISASHPYRVRWRFLMNRLRLVWKRTRNGAGNSREFTTNNGSGIEITIWKGNKMPSG